MCSKGEERLIGDKHKSGEGESDENIIQLKAQRLHKIQCVPLATEPGISVIIPITNEDIATKFEQEYVRCVRNEEERFCIPL